MAADSTRTKSELRIAVASKLGVLTAGNTVSGNSATRIDDAIDNKLRELEEKGLIRFDVDGDAIEVSVFSHLVYIIADYLADDFALDDSMAARLKMGAKEARIELNESAFEGYVYSPVQLSSL